MNNKYSFSSILSLGFVLFITSCFAQEMIKAENLIVSEGFKNPIGFYDATPTFSWQLPLSKEVKSQSGYQIVVANSAALLQNNPDLWDSNKVKSSQTTWIQYAGEKLNSRQKVYWQIRYWNEKGEKSKWSDVHTFELGLLNSSEWKAKWIGLPTAKDSLFGVKKHLKHKIQYLRKDFKLSSDVVFARLYITAKGVFDASINGKKISNDVMSPGWTQYNKRIETLTYDVTSFMISGNNTIGVEVAPGWYSGRLLGGNKSDWENKSSPKVLCQLELIMKDGSKKIIVSDETWKGTTNGPIRFSEIYDGEIYDANLEIPTWSTSKFNDKSWGKVEVTSIDNAVLLEPKRHSAVKQKDILATQEIIKKSNASLIFDLKQNMVGVPLVRVPMKKGDTLKIRFAEMLDPDGSFSTQNYRGAKSTDYYIAAEDKMIVWSPKFTFHGFRYVELSGYDTSKEPTKDWVTGVVQYSDFEEQGSFTSSHEKLNQLQSNIVWGLRGNFFDIPTDCPQRDERLGWTGDAQVFAPTSIFNADVYSFWTSWLQSLRETQSENGLIPFVIPDVLNNKQASSGWGDAAVIIPWDIYYRTGDVNVLRENYEMMKKWIGYHEFIAKDYVSDMNSFGDWLQPYPVKGGTKGDTPRSLISTAYFAHVSKLMAETAHVLNNSADESKYNTLYKNVALAFENKFFDENGKVKDNGDTQTAYLLAIGFDLLTKEKKQLAIPHLLTKIKEADNHLRTGFLGTPLLSKVLDEIGKVDLMYSILFNETYPSWFYSINQGATTIWERWNSYSKTEGFSKEKMNSLNHYAYGAIGQWMYERVAGIAPLEAGYKKIRIAPQPKKPLQSASASLNTPFGKVSSSWKIINNFFELETTIPPNTTAIIEIPANTKNDLILNGQVFKEDVNVKRINSSKDLFELEVQPGTYRFQSVYK